jgi:hypothetical protein
MEAPVSIGTNKLIEFTLIDSRHSTTDQTTIEVPGTILGPASFLAICEDEDRSGYYLFYCDKVWREWNDLWFESIYNAKEYAEKEYIGSIETWQPGL